MSGISSSRVRFPSGIFKIFKTGAASILASFDLTNLTASRAITLPDKAGTLAMISDVTGASAQLDGTFEIDNTASPTKVLKFSAASITAGQTRTMTAPDRSTQFGGVDLWTTATKYIIGDVIGVSYLGSIRAYRCTTAHTAGATFAGDVANWTFLGALQFEAAAFGILQTADPTKILTFDPSLLTASRSVTVPDKAGTMAMLSDITAGSLADTQFLYRQAAKNSNFDVWTRNGTSFTNPATLAGLANDWYIRKANGGGTAPSVNISRDTTIPNKLSKYSMKLDVTAAGTANATMEYSIYQNIFDYERFQGRSISMSCQILAPTASETIELCIDDGVTTTLHSAKTVTNSWAVYKFENIAISASATKLQFIFRLAGGTSLSIPAAANFKPSTTGAFYFTQCQLNDGTAAIDYKPKSIATECAAKYCQGVLKIDAGAADQTIDFPFDWTGGRWEAAISLNAPSVYFDNAASQICLAFATYDSLTNATYTAGNQTALAGAGGGNFQYSMTGAYPAGITGATATSITVKSNATYTTYLKWSLMA